MPSYGPQAFTEDGAPAPERLLVFGHSVLGILNSLQTLIAQISPGFCGAHPVDQGVTVDHNQVIDFFSKKGLLVQGQ